MSAAHKRWDQFGPYSLERRDAGRERLPSDHGALGFVPISFGESGRRICAPCKGAAITVVNETGFAALSIDGETGVYVQLSAQSARGMAANLLRMAEHLESLSA